MGEALQKTPDVDAISSDGIDATAAWRVESKAPVMEQDLDWLHEDLEGGVGQVAREAIEEMEDDIDQKPLQEVAIGRGSAPSLS